MTIRRTAGLQREQCITRGLSILTSAQASGGEGQTSVDKGKPVFRKTRVGRDTDTAGKILLKTKGKADKTKEESRVIFQKLSY